MTSDLSHYDNGPPTEEIYLELRELQSATAETADATPEPEPVPVMPEDDPSGVKARIARLRAILTDRGAEPPT